MNKRALFGFIGLILLIALRVIRLILGWTDILSPSVFDDYTWPIDFVAMVMLLQAYFATLERKK